MAVTNILNTRFVKMGFIKPALFIAVIFLTSGCKENAGNAVPENYSVKNNVITLTENSTIKPRLVIESPTQQVVNIDLTVNGFVRAIPSQYAQIAPPFSGRITKLFVKLGQNIKVGTPVFAISSSDYFTTQQEYLANVQELKNAEINLKRQQDLYNNAVGIKRELEEAQTDYSIKKLAVDNAEASLRVYNVNPATMRMGEALIITSPIAGTVINNDLILGQYVKEDSEPLVTVAELNKVWIAAQVKEKDLAILIDLDEVELISEVYSNQSFTGKVVNIGQIVNEETRSVEILVEVDNTTNLLKPGMYVSVKLKDAGKETLVIPSKAVFQQNDSQFVFLQVGPDQFKKQKITTLSTENTAKVAVINGLNITDKVITNGGIYLLQAK